MVHATLGKRKRDDAPTGRSRRKIVVKQRQYVSPGSGESSEPDDFDEGDLVDSDQHAEVQDPSNIKDKSNSRSNHTLRPLSSTEDLRTPRTLMVPSPVSTSESDSEDVASLHSNPNDIKLSKRNDSGAFANSISAILSSKLTSSKRADPVLARSATAVQANQELASAKLESQARQKLREDKKTQLEKGRVKDVLLGTDAAASIDIGPLSARARINEQNNGNVAASESALLLRQELEKRLRKTAQRGVVKLFNAVRQAQVRAEEASKESGGRARKEERAGEMSRKGFLEMVAGGRATPTSRKAAEDKISDET